jgi:hypothetical protein
MLIIIRTIENKNDIERFEVSTALTMKNAVFWDVTQCGSYKNRSFFFVFLRSVLQMLVTANVVRISAILFTLMLEAIRSPEMSVFIRVT